MIFIGILKIPVKGVLLAVTEVDQCDNSQVFDIYWNRDFILETKIETINSQSSKAKKKKAKPKIDTHYGYKLCDSFGQPTGTDLSILLLFYIYCCSYELFFHKFHFI